jgi:phosphate transport system substrate-binding protein
VIPAAALLLGGFLFSCQRDSVGKREYVEVDGSSTVYPIAEAVSEEFQRLDPGVVVGVGRSGTGGGFNRFCRGETDIATASRTILPTEVERCIDGGVEYLVLPVALDGLSVIVNPRNTFVTCLTVSELRQIWRPGSQVRTWRDVRPEFPGEPIRLYGPGTDSGTFDTFTRAIVGDLGASRTDFQTSEDDNVLVAGITGDENSLGYFGFAYLMENQDALKVVEVDGGNGCVPPTPETIRDGSYSPLGRQLYLYVRRASLRRPGMQAYLEYFMTHAADLIPATGFLPLPDSLYRENLQRIGASGG